MNWLYVSFSGKTFYEECNFFLLLCFFIIVLDLFSLSVCHQLSSWFLSYSMQKMQRNRRTKRPSHWYEFFDWSCLILANTWFDVLYDCLDVMFHGRWFFLSSSLPSINNFKIMWILFIWASSIHVLRKTRRDLRSNCTIWQLLLRDWKLADKSF